jgi:hypothetical protein
MRGFEKGSRAEKPGEMLVRIAEDIGPGVFNLGRGDFVSVRTPAERRRSRFTGDEITAVEVFHYSDNLLLSGKNGWQSSGIKVFKTRNFGIPHTQIDPIHRVFVDRGDGLPRIEVNADSQKIPFFPQLFDGCFDALMAVKPQKKWPNVSVKDPLGAIKIGKFVGESVDVLLNGASGKNKLPAETIGAPPHLFHVPGTQRLVDFEADFPYRDVPASAESALYLLDGSNMGVYIRRYMQALGSPLYQVIVPYLDGEYRTYVVHRDNLSLGRVIQNDQLETKNQPHLSVEWVPSGECIDVVKAFETVIAATRTEN